MHITFGGGEDEKYRRIVKRYAPFCRCFVDRKGD
jgi:hypothetical protein